MSKRSRRDNKHTLSKLLSLPRAVPSLPRLAVTYKTNNFALGLIEDRRTFEPGLKPYNRSLRQMTVGKPARLHLVENTRYSAPSQTKALVAFQEPDKLPLCVRRGIRKQVLHAKGVAGSKKPQNKPRRNEWSDVSCQS